MKNNYLGVMQIYRDFNYCFVDLPIEFLVVDQDVFKDKIYIEYKIKNSERRFIIPFIGLYFRSLNRRGGEDLIRNILHKKLQKKLQSLHVLIDSV